MVTTNDGHHDACDTVNDRCERLNYVSLPGENAVMIPKKREKNKRKKGYLTKRKHRHISELQNPIVTTTVPFDSFVNISMT